MKHLTLTFGDIAQSNILYFDKKVEKACFNICETLRIDNMPDYDSEHYYELEGQRFIKKKIHTENKLKIEDRIFDDSLIQKFQSNRHNVLFVFKGQVMMGIVHFSDYNQTIVLQAIQDDVLTFERKMRQYLFLKGFRNQDMLDFFKYRSKRDENSRRFYTGRLTQLERRKDELNQLGEFQVFDLKDLLEFGNSSKSKRLFPCSRIQIGEKDINQIHLVNSLRNMAMHGKNPVQIDEGTSIYSMDSLAYLFQALKTLKKFTYRIEKLIAEHEDYQKSVKMDNQSKLEIIHEHHPKALNYFVGH